MLQDALHSAAYQLDARHTHVVVNPALMHTHPLLSVFALPLDQSVHRLENVVGWYHSHPGYGCWLSGIDCSTQMTNQQYQEPFLAIVVDPVRTMA